MKHRVVFVHAVLSFLLCGIRSSSQQSPKPPIPQNQGIPKSNKPEQGHATTQSPASIGNQLGTDKTDADAKQSKENIEIQRKLVTATIALAVIGGLQFVVLVIQSVAFFRTLKTLNRQARISLRQTRVAQRAANAARDNASAAQANAEAAKANAVAAERSVELFIAKERARITVQVDPLNLAPTPDLSFFEAGYKVFNYGPALAFIVDARTLLKISQSPDPPDDKPFVPMSLGPVVIPTTEGIKNSTVCFDKFRLEQADIDSINQERMFIYYYGFVKYRDISTKEGTEFWETRWMHLWNVTDFKNFDGSVFAYWMKCGPPEANRET